MNEVAIVPAGSAVEFSLYDPSQETKLGVYRFVGLHGCGAGIGWNVNLQGNLGDDRTGANHHLGVTTPPVANALRR